ncbi:putative biotin/lipoyl attachment [Medicago truncatula]|uniref:Biotin/lipoyl attachment domain protein n=1 Tax=Medicago truncatula TaxID=3880 RepID=G7J2E7_MEDTR|nr:biotin carboxyl carrier protein of acetyl-CoA carboxylase [Medicago truncatula]AES71252.1 biotin/lipoyl attachment domain protein [Medicago truncatula]RHN68466.1 putative biotin/lipoyl attachment [Medicago truncatula]
MDSSAAIRSFHYPIGTISHVRSSIERAAVVPCHKIRWNSNRGKKALVSCAKAVEAINTTKSDASLDSTQQDKLEKKPLQTATFPDGFEALILDVCDETEIAELKLKVGEFEMHLKRNIGATKAPLSNISPTTPPPIPSKPMDESAPTTAQPLPPTSSSEKTNPFANVSSQKSSKLIALEASGTSTYALVSSPTVGSFRRGRTVKGQKHPPICKEGDVIREGQVIGYLDQFGVGAGIPIKSDVAGEVLKLLLEEGDPVGFGDPILAVLPSFHDIK